MIPEESKKLKSPCLECPFTSNCEPNALGGSPPETYIGQALGPFWIPCHMDVDFDDPNWKQDYTKGQCAGLAIFRANIGVDRLMPKVLLKLPSDNSKAFSSEAELLAHHREISLEEAKEILKTPGHTPVDCLKKELRKLTDDKIHIVKKT